MALPAPTDAQPWHHQFIETNGIRLHAVTQGSGPLMLLLHGFPEFWYTWRYQIPIFAERYQVVAVDLRGYNDSDKPREVSAYALPELVQDVVGVITALGHDRCILVGHDWGGAIAWNVAYDHTHLVEKLIILNCPHPQRFLEGFTDPRQWFRSAYMAFFQLPWLPEQVIQANDYDLIGRTFQSLAAQPRAITATDIHRYKTAIARPGALTAALNYYRNLPALLSKGRESWGVLTVPTLLIWGEADPVFEPSLATGTEAYVRDFHLRLLPYCGHWVPQEAPGEVNHYIAQFLAG